MAYPYKGKLYQVTLKHNCLVLHALGIYLEDEENAKKQNINCFLVIIMLAIIYVNVLTNLLI